MMPRIFLERPLTTGETLHIDGPDAHHYVRVLRAQPGEPVALAADGTAFLGEIVSVSTSPAIVSVKVQEPLSKHEPDVRIVLVQGLAKGDKIEEVLQKCTEAGVTDFVVMPMARSVVRLDDKKVADRIDRWQRQVREAAAQSQRDRVPTVTYAKRPTELRAAFQEWTPACVLLLDEAEQTHGIGHALRAVRETAGRSNSESHRIPTIAVIVGPEGGIDDDERRGFVEDLRAQSVTLGPRIFRTENAGLAAVCAVLYEYGAMGGR